MCVRANVHAGGELLRPPPVTSPLRREGLEKGFRSRNVEMLVFLPGRSADSRAERALAGAGPSLPALHRAVHAGVHRILRPRKRRDFLQQRREETPHVLQVRHQSHAPLKRRALDPFSQLGHPARLRRPHRLLKLTSEADRHAVLLRVRVRGVLHGRIVHHGHHAPVFHPRPALQVDDSVGRVDDFERPAAPPHQLRHHSLVLHRVERARAVHHVPAHLEQRGAPLRDSQLQLV